MLQISSCVCKVEKKSSSRYSQSQEKYIYQNRVSSCNTIHSKSFHRTRSIRDADVQSQNDSKRKYKYIFMNNPRKSQEMERAKESQQANRQSTIDNIAKVQSRQTVDNINFIIEQETKAHNVFKQIEIIKNNQSNHQSRSSTPLVPSRKLQSSMSVSKNKPVLREQPSGAVQKSQSPPAMKRMTRRKGFNIHNKYDVMVNKYCQNLQ